MTNVTRNFAKACGLEIIPVLAGGDVEEAAYTEDGPHTQFRVYG